MGKYVNLKCGSCGYSFTHGYTPGYVSVLGVSKKQCPSCFTLNDTSSLPYSKFTSFDRIYFWFGRIIRIVIRGPLYGSLLGYGVTILFDSQNGVFIFSGAIIGLFANIILNYFSIKDEISRIEREDLTACKPHISDKDHIYTSKD